MAHGQVARQPQEQQQLKKQESQDGYEVEAHESSVGASGSGGLNLNLAGAISGLFGSKSHKDTAADGSSVEQRDERAAVSGSGAANASTYAAAQAHARDAGFKQHIPIGDAPGVKQIEDKQ